MVDASPALLEQLADSVVVVVGVVDAAREVLADELAFAVRGVDLGVEEVAGARPGEVAGPRGLWALLFACGLISDYTVHIGYKAGGGTRK